MNCDKACSGFALFTVVLMVAIIGLISLATVNSYLGNTRATSLDVQRIKVEQLLDSGVRFAALSLASPRSKVFSSAIPSERLVYRAPSAKVLVNIENEAGFVDLLRADQALLESVLLSVGAPPSQLSDLISSIQSLEYENGRQKLLSYRALRALLAGTTIRHDELLSVATLHNGQKGVHPGLASENVLALVPRLSKAQRERILADRNDSSPSLISNPIGNEYFASNISAYYRISVSVVLQDQTYSRVQIIKMINQLGNLYEVQATL